MQATVEQVKAALEFVFISLCVKGWSIGECEANSPVQHSADRTKDIIRRANAYLQRRYSATSNMRSVRAQNGEASYSIVFNKLDASEAQQM